MAVKDRATINSEAASLLADNNTQDISAADVRGRVEDLADSSFNPSDDNTDNITEGTKKFYASSLFDADLATKDTDDLTEGATNKYVTATEKSQIPTSDEKTELTQIQKRAWTTLTDGATVTLDYSAGHNNTVTIADTRILAVTNIADGQILSLKVVQGGTESYTLNLGNVNGAAATHKVVNGGGGALTLSTGVGEIDILTGIWDNTAATMYWTVGLNYS